MHVEGVRATRLLVVVALLATMFVPVAPAVAAGQFTGGAYDVPMYVPNDHTPIAFRFEVTGGLAADTDYYMKVRFTTVPTTPWESAMHRGFTWNPDTQKWVQERDAWIDYPIVTTDGAGKIPKTWAWCKFGDENVSGTRYLVVSLSAAGADDTFNAGSAPALTVLDMETQGSWIHNGAATGIQAEKRAEATQDDNDTIVFALSKTEGNTIDDDSNGVVDDEDYGPGDPGDYRLAVPAATSVDVYLNRNTPGGTLQDFVSGPADTDLAGGAVETVAPSRPGSPKATGEPEQIRVTWSAATDNAGVSSYKVMRWVEPTDVTPPFSQVHEVAATLAAGVTTYVDTDVEKDVIYSYEIRAVDAAGNIGPRSATVSAAPMGAGDLRVLAGDNRFLTSVAISKATFPAGSVEKAVIATGMNFADALAASGLAGACDGPLLLVGPTVAGETLVELDRLGVKEVLIVGGESAVSPTVAAQLATGGRTVRRPAAGVDRYDTAARVADAILDESGAPPTTFFARGDAFADALAAAPAAYAAKAPILLVRPDVVPGYTATAIKDIGLSSGVALGGTAAISDATLASLDGLMSGKVERVGGSDRYATAAMFAEFVVADGHAEFGSVGVATGVEYADALSGGPAIGAARGVMLLTDPASLPVATSATIDAHRPEIDVVTVFGGTVAVSSNVRTQIANILK